MALVGTNDDVIWVNAVHEDEGLRKLILELPAGAIITLEFPEFGNGSFAKMRNDASGRPTNGIRPLPATRTLWRQIKQQKHGAAVQVRLLDTKETAAASVTKFSLSPQQREWASKSRQGVPAAELEQLLIQQAGRCALSGVEMVFDLKERTPENAGLGCHPLSPAVDHIDPGNPNGGHQIVCYALNDFKGHMRAEFFESTAAWKNLIDEWRRQAEADPTDRNPFMRLLRPNAVPKRRRN